MPEVPTSDRPAAGRRLVLLAGAPALVALTIAVAPWIGRHASSPASVLYLALLYWAGCWVLALAGTPRGGLAALYRTAWNRRRLELILTWLPAVVTLVGAFVASFPGRAWLGLVYPWALFTAWHVALARLPRIHWVSGGAVHLVAGAALAGLAWGLVVYRTRDLRSVTIAHVLTNVFAFSGLVLANWAGELY